MTPKAVDKPNHATRLVERNFRVTDGQLQVGDMTVAELAEKYGTPLFIYDRGLLSRQLDALRSALTARFDIFYSIKANPNQNILKFFVSQGCGLEIASVGELLQALKAGCPAESIVFAGPGKRDEELAAALANEIGEIHVESLGEVKRLARLAESTGRRPRIALRVNPLGDAQGGAMRMGGKATPFGIDEERLDEAVDQIVATDRLDLVGVHLFTGTQILDHEVLITQYRRAVDIARRMANRLGRPLETIDFGGGLGIPYFAHETPLDLDALAAGVAELIADIRGDALLRDARLIVEPGRFLVGEAGLYVTRVLDVKTSRDKKFVVVDGGMHHHLAASGNLGQTIKRNYPVALANKMDDSHSTRQTADFENGKAVSETVDVVGSLCTPLDVLARGVALPTAEVGDLFVVFQSGAYARSASPLGFLSHDAPPEVCVDSEQDRLIRRRGAPNDYLIGQTEMPLNMGISTR